MVSKDPETEVKHLRCVGQPRILLADEHPIFRDALRALFQAAHFQVIGEACDCEAVLRLSIDHHPDILLLHWALARRDGMSVLRKLADSGLAIRTLLFSVVLDKTELLEALRLGVFGVVVKSATTQMFMEGIQSVLSGHYWVGQDSLASLIAALQDPTPALMPHPLRNDFGLTPRELQILAAVHAGYSNSDIAADSSLSSHTVKHHLTHIFDKVGVSTRIELARFAMNHRLVSSTS